MKKKSLENPELIAFGQRLKDTRKNLDIQQKDFAEKLRMSGSFLSEVEKGKAKPGYDFIKNLIVIFDMNPLYLFTGEGPAFTREIKEPESTGLRIEITENKEIFEEMFRYFTDVPAVKYAVLEFFKKYLFDHKEMIEFELKKLKKTNKESQE
ncbi:MAG: helix-turn-helix transcriptional regulator [Candidatus Aminicenantes bacterium]|nr:helix-turn-helix transcriptional regulator [Candidatus Aminicenantes bacterium]